jgi:hypothetical protein
MLRKLLLTATTIVALELPGMVSAEIINFQLMGTITYGGTLATIGSPITGSFAYDTDALLVVSMGEYAAYEFNAPFGFSGNASGHTIATNRLSVSIWNNFGGNVEDMIEVSGSYPVTVDGISYPNGSFGFRLASRPGNTTVLNNTALPYFFDVSAFDAGPTLNYGWLQRDGAPGGQLLQFSINSITPVPVPPAFMLMLSGLMVVAGAFLRSSKPA